MLPFPQRRLSRASGDAMKFVAGLLCLLLTLVAVPSRSIDFGGRGEGERRAVERAREGREAKDSWLVFHEGSERGRTMELYVPKDRVVQLIHDGLFRQETLRRQVAELSGDAADSARRQGLADGYSSMYLDRVTAERATARTIRENRAAIEAWQRDAARSELEIVVRDHGEAVGEVLLEKAGEVDPRHPQTEVSRGSIVRLVKEGKDRYYIASSHPLHEGADLQARARDAASRIEAAARENRILDDAARGVGNFGLGSASAPEADALGKRWVGEGYRTASDGKTLVSKEGLRQYRPPSLKPNSPFALTGTQANFEQRSVAQGRWQSNGHLDITPTKTP